MRKLFMFTNNIFFLNYSVSFLNKEVCGVYVAYYATDLIKKYRLFYFQGFIRRT